MLTEAEIMVIVNDVRGHAPEIPEASIRWAIGAYTERGADGVGNKLGIIGTYIACQVDKIRLNRGKLFKAKE